MRPVAPPALLDAIGRWATLSRWERAEVGRALRRLGWSYGEIRDVIDVPKGTLAGWCRDIMLTGEQTDAIKARSGSARGVPRDTQRRRRAEVTRIRTAAREFARCHLDDPLFVAGTVLYWGEGAKTKQMLAVTNADPAALRLFINWVEAFHDDDPTFVLSLHLHQGDDDASARRWWSEQLSLQRPAFTRTFVKPPGTGHRQNRLLHGVCRVRLRRSTDAFYRTIEWIDVIAGALGTDSTGTG